MRIDAHIHTFSSGFFPQEWFEAIEQRWTMASWPPRPAEAIRGRIEPGMLDPTAKHVGQALNNAQIDRALWIGLDPWVLLRPKNPGDGHAHLRRQVDLVRQSKGRFLGVAGIDPRRRDAVQLAKAAFEDFGMVGLKIYPPHGYYPHDPVCAPLYEACVTHDAVAVVHSAATQYPLLSHYANPLYLQDVQLAYPSLTIVIAHAGYPMWWQEAAIVASGHASTYLEISHWDRLIDVDRDRLLHILRRWQRDVGAHRMVFGTDYFGGPRFANRAQLISRWATFIASCGVFSGEELDLIMGGNATRIIPSFVESADGVGESTAHLSPGARGQW